MSSQMLSKKKSVGIRSAINGFDRKYGSLPVGELTVVSVPQPNMRTQGVIEIQREIARAYVKKVLLSALQDGSRVKHVFVGDLSKTRRAELELIQQQFPKLFAFGTFRGKSSAVRIQQLTRLLTKLEAGKGTDLILVDGIETLSRQQLKESKSWVKNCYMDMPKQLKYLGTICKCPVLVVQLETHSSKLLCDSAENLWFNNSEIALTLRRRDGLCLVAPDGSIRKGIEARLVKSPQGRSDDDRWMV